jgi:hypothetical protein
MREWLIAGWVVAGLLYVFGMLATRNTVVALRNSVFGEGTAWEVVSGLLALVFWPIAQILATLTVEGPSGRGDWRS